MRVASLDGYKAAWVAVVLEDGRFEEGAVYPTAHDAIHALRGVAAVGIDVPIGLPIHPPRAADAAARRAVGPRWQSVFLSCSRAITEQSDHTTAVALARSRGESGPSRQAFGLFPKILEVDALLGEHPEVFEVHPEVSFAVLKGDFLTEGKKTWNGVHERLNLLASAGIELPSRLPVGAAPADDVIDAAVGAWSAWRKARGLAVSFPDQPERLDGRDVSIWA